VSAHIAEISKSQVTIEKTTCFISISFNSW